MHNLNEKDFLEMAITSLCYAIDRLQELEKSGVHSHGEIAMAKGIFREAKSRGIQLKHDH